MKPKWDISHLQWTRTREIWEATLRLTTNTIWYYNHTHYIENSSIFRVPHPLLICCCFSCCFLQDRLFYQMIILHRLPILPIWQALLAARLLSTLPPSWASWCQIKVFSTLKQIPLCSEGAPPGANGHPVPITYEGFTLLTDNNNNYFMSSFIPQVKTDWKLKVWSCQFISVQLLPDARLPDQPVPTEASVWLAASWQAFLEVSATHQLAHSTHPSSSISE